MSEALPPPGLQLPKLHLITEEQIQFFHQFNMDAQAPSGKMTDHFSTILRNMPELPPDLAQQFLARQQEQVNEMITAPTDGKKKPNGAKEKTT